MKNIFVVQLMRALTAEDQPNLRKFLNSPYFNHREDICVFYEVLLDYRKNDYSIIDKKQGNYPAACKFP